MIGGIILGGLVVGMCMLMAFGEEEHWVRGGLRNLGMLALFLGIGAIAVFALYGT